METINLDKVMDTYNRLLNWPDKETWTSFFYKCPYHKEKSPSFAVKKENGIFKCFWCGKSWNIITLIRDHFVSQQEELFQFLWLGYWNGTAKKRINITDYIKKEIVNNLPWQLEQRINHENKKYLYSRWFTDGFISKYNFFNLNNNISNILIEKVKKNIEESKNKRKDNSKDINIRNKEDNKLLTKYKDFLDKWNNYYKGYLIIPTPYGSNFTNNYMFVWRNTSSANGPRYKNEKMNKIGKDFYIWKSHDNVLTIMEWTIDWMLYNNFTNKTVNLLLWANKINYENKLITFLTDNDQAWFEFLWNLYDIDNMFNNNNLNYIFWAISYKEVFKNFFLKTISNKYKFEIDSDIFEELIAQYWNILIEIKDFNELYKFIIKLLYITEETLWKNKTEDFIEKIKFNNVLSYDFNKIWHEFIERKDIQIEISNLINVFDKSNIEQNTFIIFFFYYNIIKDKIDMMDNVDIQFFIDSIKDKEQMDDIAIENIKRILIKRNPYFIMSYFLYYFWIEWFVKVSNHFLYKTNNIDKLEANIIKSFNRFVKQYKINLLQPEILYLFKKIRIITENSYKNIIKKIEEKTIKNTQDEINYENLIKSKMYYWRVFIIPLILSLFTDEVSYNVLSNLLRKDNKDVINLSNLVINTDKYWLNNFTDLKKINDLKNVIREYVLLKRWKDYIINNLWSSFLNLFWLNKIENLSEINYIIEEMNKSDIENNIKIMWLENIIRLRTIKDINNYIDKYNMDRNEFKEDISYELNLLNKENKTWSTLSNKTDEGVLLTMIQNNKEKLSQNIDYISKEIKMNKIILWILQSFILYI